MISDSYQDTGPDIFELDHSPENAWERLRKILDDKVLRFNPYLVDDNTLIDCAMRGYWRPLPALTQMVIFKFLDIRKVKAPYHGGFDAIFYQVGNLPGEHYFPIYSFIRRTSYRPTRHAELQMIGKQRITNHSMVDKLQGKSYFARHGLKGHYIQYGINYAFRMTRLWGTDAHRAQLIREAMVTSKITMMEELLKYPYNLDYLACPRHLIDYEPIVRQQIERFRHYTDARPE